MKQMVYLIKMWWHGSRYEHHLFAMFQWVVTKDEPGAEWLTEYHFGRMKYHLERMQFLQKNKP